MRLDQDPDVTIVDDAADGAAESPVGTPPDSTTPNKPGKPAFALDR